MNHYFISVFFLVAFCFQAAAQQPDTTTFFSKKERDQLEQSLNKCREFLQSKDAVTLLKNIDKIYENDTLKKIMTDQFDLILNFKTKHVSNLLHDFRNIQLISANDSILLAHKLSEILLINNMPVEKDSLLEEINNLTPAFVPFLSMRNYFLLTMNCAKYLSQTNRHQYSIDYIEGLRMFGEQDLAAQNLLGKTIVIKPKDYFMLPSDYLNLLLFLGKEYVFTGRLNKCEELEPEIDSLIAKSIRGDDFYISFNISEENLLSLTYYYLFFGRQDKVIPLLDHWLPAINTFSKKISGMFNSDKTFNADQTDVLSFYLYTLLGEEKKAAEILSDLKVSMFDDLKKSYRYLYSKDREDFLETYDRYYNYLMSCSLFPQRLPVSGDILNYVLNRKSIALTSNIMLHHSTEAESAEVQRKLEVYKKLKKESNNIERGSYSTPNPQIERAIDSLEYDLFRNNQGYINEISNNTIDCAMIRKEMKAGEASIEFVTFETYNYWNPDQRNIRYAAIILRPEYSDPVIVPLCTELILSAQLSQWLDNPDARGVPETVGSNSSTGLAAIYQLIWKPLLPYLEGYGTIYYSTDGLLHRVPFAALTDESGTSLCQTIKLVQLISTRQLVRNVRAPQPNDLLIIGDLDYGTAAGADAARQPFQNLAFGAVEVNNIVSNYHDKNLTCKKWAGADGTEAAIKTLDEHAPHNIHFCTHGGYWSIQDPGFTNVETAASDPLSRCFLACSKANVAWGDKNIPPQNDGLLTGFEIASLELSNTDLVILSACETGIGDIKGAEGVYSLQRAFKLAGVEYVLMTLWSVEDKATAEFMTRLYHIWLDGQPFLAAFQQTQREMQQQYANEPSKWAAFVLIR